MPMDVAQNKSCPQQVVATLCLTSAEKQHSISPQLAVLEPPRPQSSHIIPMVPYGFVAATLAVFKRRGLAMEDGRLGSSSA